MWPGYCGYCGTSYYKVKCQECETVFEVCGCESGKTICDECDLEGLDEGELRDIIDALRFELRAVFPIARWLQPFVERGEQVGNLDMEGAKRLVDALVKAGCLDA